MKVEVASKRKSILGEGPHWDERSGTLLYDDARGPVVLRYDPKTKTDTEILKLDHEIGNMIPYAEDNRKLVVCMGNGVYNVDLHANKTTLLTEMLDKDAPGPTRINDGKCDAMGRLWAGQYPCVTYINNNVQLATSYAYGVVLRKLTSGDAAHVSSNVFYPVPYIT
ncbi:hypothetical protein MRX96_028384 [Rhipicephalus microplus]